MAKIPEDEKFMMLALKEAKKALLKKEVPIGALVVIDGKVISRAHNLRESRNDPTAHAELLALRKASKKIGSWRLNNSTLYSTCEPCPMCAGAIVLARVKRLVYGCRDKKAGAVRSLYKLCDDPRLNHRLEIKEGVLEEECSELLKKFFKNLRA